MSVWDDAEQEIEQESLSGKVVEAAKSWGSVTLRGAKAIASNIKDDIGRSIGLLTSPMAAYFGFITPYDDPSEEAAFHEQSLKDQLLIRTGSSLQSAVDAITKKGSYGKTPLDYYKSVTGEEAPLPYELFTMLADPSIAVGAGAPIIGKFGKLSKAASKMGKLTKSIDNILDDVPKSAFDEALAKKKGTVQASKNVDDLVKGSPENKLDNLEYEQWLDDVEAANEKNIPKIGETTTGKNVWDEAASTAVKTETKVAGATDIPPEGVKSETTVDSLAPEQKTGIPEGETKAVGGEPDSIRIESDPNLKTAKAASDANKQFVKSGIGELPEDELAKYNTVTFEQLEAKIASFMDSHSIDELSDIATGRKPSGLSKTEEQVLYNALKKRAIVTVDEELGDKLAKSKIATERSEQAQALGASRLGNLIDDPIETFKDIVKEVVEKTFKRTGKKPTDVSSKLNTLSEGLKSIEKKIVEKVRGTKSITELEKDLKKAIDEDNYTKVEMIISKLTRAFGEVGILERDASTQAVLEVVQKHMPTASFEAVRDAQSKAGQWKAWAKDNITTKLAQNNQERVALYKRDALKGGRVPNPSGQPWPPVSDDLPLLNKIVNQGMKRLGIKSLVKEKKKISIADQKKERLARKIESAELRLEQKKKQIASGKLTEKTEQVTSEKLMTLEAEERLLNNELAEMRNALKVVDEVDQLEKAIDKKWKTIFENERKIAENDIAVRQGKPQDPRIQALNNINKDLNKQIRKMRDDLKVKKTAQEIAEARLEKRLLNEIKSLDEQIETATRVSKTKLEYDYSPKIEGLKAQKAAKQKEYNEFFGEEIAADKLEKDITNAINDIKKLERQIVDEDFAVNVRGEKQRAPQLQRLLTEKKRLQDIVKEKRLALDPEAQYRAKLEKENKDLNELLKMAEEADTGSLEVMRKAYSAKTPKKDMSVDTKKLIAKRDQLKNDYDAIMKASGIPTKTELGKLMSLSRDKMRLAEQYDAKTGKWASPDAEAAYGLAAEDYQTFVDLLRNGDYTVKELAARRLQEFKTTWKGTDSAEGRPFLATRDVMFDLFKEISLASKSMVGSWDASFILRQGRHVLMTHPSAWWPSAKAALKVLIGSVIDKHGAEKAMRAYRAQIMSNPLYMDGTFQKAGVVDFMEEEFMSNLPQRIPGLGRVFKASEVSFVIAGEIARTTAFEVMYKNALKSGAADAIKSGAIKADDLIKDFGEIAGSLTGRSRAKVPEVIQPILWAPKMVAANLNVLTGHYAGFGGQLRTSFARKEAMKNLGKIASTYIGLAIMINQIRPGTIELDPRSSDFLKARFFNTRIDLTQGIGQYVVYFARALSGLASVAGIGEGGVLSAQTGIMHKINTGNEKDPTLQDLTIQFFTNKAAPFPRAIIDTIFRGKTFEGEKPTLDSIAASMFAPIPVQNMWKNTKGDYAVAPELWSSSWEVKVAALATALEFLGVSANTYIPTKIYSEADTKEMRELIGEFGKDRVKMWEIEYNKTVNARIDKTVKESWYKRLDNEEKKDVIKDIKAETKKEVFGL